MTMACVKELIPRSEVWQTSCWWSRRGWHSFCTCRWWGWLSGCYKFAWSESTEGPSQSGPAKTTTKMTSSPLSWLLIPPERPNHPHPPLQSATRTIFSHLDSSMDFSRPLQRVSRFWWQGQQGWKELQSNTRKDYTKFRRFVQRTGTK